MSAHDKKPTKYHVMKSFPNGGLGNRHIEMYENKDGDLYGFLCSIKFHSIGSLGKELLALEKEINDLGFSVTSIELDHYEAFLSIYAKKDI